MQNLCLYVGLNTIFCLSLIICVCVCPKTIGNEVISLLIRGMIDFGRTSALAKCRHFLVCFFRIDMIGFELKVSASW